MPPIIQAPGVKSRPRQPALQQTPQAPEKRTVGSFREDWEDGEVRTAGVCKLRSLRRVHTKYKEEMKGNYKMTGCSREGVKSLEHI